MSALRDPLKRARGLGASHTGAHHWWAQRLSALALIPLSIWFVVNAVTLLHADHAAAAAFVAAPVDAVLLVLFATVLLWHSYLGLQVVVEDYAHPESVKLAIMVLLQFIHVALAAGAVFAVLKVAVGG